jgi:hypothetical protein
VTRVASRITVAIDVMYNEILKDLGVISPRAEITSAAAIVAAVDRTSKAVKYSIIFILPELD